MQKLLENIRRCNIGKYKRLAIDEHPDFCASTATADKAVQNKTLSIMTVTTDRTDNYLGLYRNGYDLSVKSRQHADEI